MPHGSLSIPARLCLLAWDPTGAEAADAAHLVRAGALAELARRGLLTDEDGIATPVDMDSLAGDAPLDGLLELVRESRPHPWRAWVLLHARVTADAVREQLTAEGWLRAEKRRVLGVFPSVEHVLERADAVETLREEARQVWEGVAQVSGASGADAAVVALAVAGGVRGVVGDGGREGRRVRYRARVEEFVGLSGESWVLGELVAALGSELRVSGADRPGR
ncbi:MULTISPECIES: GOLPH3/VPS74 family protein [Streptomyces]|uniref:GPP34 family phosphoprotein n=1 Tax=Streptomyces spinosisporus TaxID=2927582 RepID=A0ABS9XA48_9ACTN|nr:MULTISPECIES: GPP34 family phosphoprotein [Streptomyces]MCI3238973.1 GPP34 family phosphoprotein [Streptomyces spinosisporus]WUB34650.1 GPP34 family phosphoprotein [Streptomyces sp. NBC_00588]